VDDEAVWNKLREELTRYASMLVGPSDAEDLLSTVVVRVLSRRHFSDLDDPRSYLYKAVTNEARSLIRFRSRRPLTTAESALPPDVQPEVFEAVLRLPNRQRAAVYLTYWRDLPVAEVAQLMGCRAGSVKRYLHMARNKLKGVLEDD
jgi:RNA polymerase sigma-70 factor (ECF subfamily)